MLILKIPEGRKSIAQSWSQYDLKQTMTATAKRTRQSKIFYEKKKSSARAFNNLYTAAPSAKYQNTQLPKLAWSENWKNDHELFMFLF